MLRLTRGFANQRLTFTLGRTSHALFCAIFWHGRMCHELTGVISQVNFVANSNSCMEQLTLTGLYAYTGVSK